MDNELREDVKTLAALQRLKDEEAYHGENIARTIEVNEEIEENEYLLRKLKKQIRIWNGVLVAGVVALIIILLYMIYVYVTLPDTTKPAEEPVVIEAVEPEPEPDPVPAVVQKTNEETLIYMLDVPDINTEDILMTTLGNLVAGLDDKDILHYRGIDYNSAGVGLVFGKEGIEEVKIDSGVEVYSLASLEKLIGNTNKVYKQIKKPRKNIIRKEVTENNCFVIKDGELKTYYNKDSLSDIKLRDKILARKSFDFTIQVYDEELPEGYLQGLLESFTYNKAYKNYEDVVNAIVNKLVKDVDKFSITYKDYSFGYYDEVYEKNGDVVCIKDGVEETPETVNTYHVTDIEVVYDTLACALEYGWY